MWSAGGLRQMSRASVRSSSAAVFAFVWSAAFTGVHRTISTMTALEIRGGRVSASKQLGTGRRLRSCRAEALVLAQGVPASRRVLPARFRMFGGRMVAGHQGSHGERAQLGVLRRVAGIRHPRHPRLVASHPRGSRGLSSPQATAPRMGRRLSASASAAIPPAPAIPACRDLRYLRVANQRRDQGVVNRTDRWPVRPLPAGKQTFARSITQAPAD
jgi:hypothetical protein